MHALSYALFSLSIMFKDRKSGNKEYTHKNIFSIFIKTYHLWVYENIKEGKQ